MFIQPEKSNEASEIVPDNFGDNTLSHDGDIMRQLDSACIGTRNCFRRGDDRTRIGHTGTGGTGCRQFKLDY